MMMDVPTAVHGEGGVEINAQYNRQRLKLFCVEE